MRASPARPPRGGAQFKRHAHSTRSSAPFSLRLVLGTVVSVVWAYRRVFALVIPALFVVFSIAGQTPFRRKVVHEKFSGDNYQREVLRDIDPCKSKRSDNPFVSYKCLPHSQIDWSTDDQRFLSEIFDTFNQFDSSLLEQAPEDQTVELVSRNVRRYEDVCDIVLTSEDVYGEVTKKLEESHGNLKENRKRLPIVCARGLRSVEKILTATEVDFVLVSTNDEPHDRTVEQLISIAKNDQIRKWFSTRLPLDLLSESTASVIPLPVGLSDVILSGSDDGRSPMELLFGGLSANQNRSDFVSATVLLGGDEVSDTVTDCERVTERFGPSVKCTVTWFSMDYNEALFSAKITLIPHWSEQAIWDAIFHGSVPLIPQSALVAANDLFRHLPFITFDDTNEIVDLSSIGQQYKDVISNPDTYDFGRLGVSPWLDSVRSAPFAS